MNARTRLNFVLLIAVIVLAAALWWLPAPEEEGAEDRPPLADLDAASAETIRIEGDNPTIDLVREAGGWRLTKPFAAPADDAAVTEIVESLNTGSFAAYDLEGLEPGEYGLDQPAAMITVDDARFAFGRLEPLSRRRYVRHDGRVHLIGNTTFYRLQQQPTELVDKRLVPEAMTPRLLELPEFSLVRNEQAGWDIRPEHPDAGADRFQKLVDHWRRARSIRIRREVPDGAEPVGTIRIEPAGEGDALMFRGFDDSGKLFLESASGEFVHDMGPDSTGRLLLLPDAAKEEGANDEHAGPDTDEPAGG